MQKKLEGDNVDRTESVARSGDDYTIDMKDEVERMVWEEKQNSSGMNEADAVPFRIVPQSSNDMNI